MQGCGSQGRAGLRIPRSFRGLRTAPLKTPGKGRGVATCPALEGSPGTSTCFPCQPRTAGTRGSGPRPRAAATRSSRMASLDQPLAGLPLRSALHRQQSGKRSKSRRQPGTQSTSGRKVRRTAGGRQRERHLGLSAR